MSIPINKIFTILSTLGILALPFLYATSLKAELQKESVERLNADQRLKLEMDIKTSYIGETLEDIKDEIQSVKKKLNDLTPCNKK